MLALNINQEPKNVIFDRFNALNALQLKPDDFVLGVSEDYVDLVRKTNTRVKASPILDSNGYNSFYIYYNKMDFSEVFDRINLEIKTTGLDQLLEIIDLINIELGIYLTFDDVTDTSIIYDDPSDKTTRAFVEVVAKPTSYLYKGTYTLILNEKLNPYDPGIKNAVTGLSFITDGTDTSIVNINTSVTKHDYFSFLNNVTINATPVIKGIKLIDNSVYVFGDFDIEPPSTLPGTQGSNVYKGITVNKIGKVLSVDLIAKFDNVYQNNVCFTPNLNNTKYYLADQKKYITGNVPGIYRYNNKGERDNTLVTTNMTAVVDKILPLSSGFIICTKMQTTPKRVVKVICYNENGTVNTAMPTIEIGDAGGIDIEVQGIVNSYDGQGLVDGFYLLLRNIFSQPLIPTLNGVKVYGTKHLNKNNYILPVLKFNLEGILDTSFNGNIPRASKTFFQPEIGEYNFTNLFSLPDGIVIFNRVSNPITGVKTLIGLRVRKDGSLELLKGSDYFDHPMVKSIVSITQNHNTFLAAVIVEELDQDDILIETAKVIGFDSNGLYTGTYLELDTTMSFKDMVVFKNWGLRWMVNLLDCLK